MTQIEPGTRWRRNNAPLEICQTIDVEPGRVSARWLRFNDDGEVCVSSPRDEFLCRTGIFLNSFSPADEIVTIKRAAEEAYRRQELGMFYVSQACIEAARKRCAALVDALPEHAELLSRIQDVVITELDQVTSALLVKQRFTKEDVMNELRKGLSTTETP
jgi:hypothetical protein